jgi:hypothetical protein
VTSFFGELEFPDDVICEKRRASTIAEKEFAKTQEEDEATFN